MTEGVDILAEIKKAWDQIRVPYPIPKLVISEAIPRGQTYQLTEFDNILINPEDAEESLAKIHDFFPGTVGDFTAINLTRALNEWKAKQAEKERQARRDWIV